MAHYQVLWNSYQTNISTGFSHLQQQEELVDMTLSADGHFVKVHKTLMALASPYLKELIQSVPGQHPVVILVSISYDILGFILEFVYTGEVKVPTHHMEAFLLAAKALHITGIDSFPYTSFTNTTGSKQMKRVTSESKSAQGDDNVPQKRDNRTADKSLHKRPKMSKETACVDPPGSETMESSIHPTTGTDFEQMISCYQSQHPSNTYPSETLDYQASVANFKIISNASVVNETNTNNFKPETTIEPFQVIGSDGTGTVQLISVNEVANGDERDETEFRGEAEEEYALGNDIEYNNMIKNIQSNNPDDTTHATTSISEPQAVKNYSVNVEMPFDKTEPPKITIQAGVIKNIPVSNEPTLESVFAHMPLMNDNFPKITIKAGVLKCGEKPEISTSNNVDSSTTKAAELCSQQATSPLYIVTAKGSLQMILNRFIYNMHHKARKGMIRRWRCIDYRHKQCKAFMDTSEDNIINRKFPHNHSFHDEKILKKGSKGQVFRSLREAAQEIGELP